MRFFSAFSFRGPQLARLAFVSLSEAKWDYMAKSGVVVVVVVVR